MRYIVKLSYCGAAFCGWQIQNDAPSVQQTLQDAISTLLRCEITVTGAGRTDTGVNAVGYVAHFDSPRPLDPEQMAYKLNAILPREIAVAEVREVSDDFHARFSATKREYTYFLHRNKNPFIERFSLFYPYRLDFDAMNRAAALMLGTHDFSCFEKTGADNKTSICTVSRAVWQPCSPFRLPDIDDESFFSGQAPGTGDFALRAHPTTGVVGGPPAIRPRVVRSPCSGSLAGENTGFAESGCWCFRIAADRFLRNMVRATVGTLLEVGRGKRGIDDFAALLNGGSRCAAGESVPGNALFFSGVKYPNF